MNKPFIVAELGANAARGLAYALDLVDAAADAGADAVKLQCWTPGTMVLDRTATTMWQGQEVNLAELYQRAWTPWEWFKTLFERARSRGIVPFASPFDRQAVDLLETLDCPIYKIASFELVDLPLIRYVASKGKPIILSSGMATESELCEAYGIARTNGLGKGHVTALVCTSAYPADASQTNLKKMERFWEMGMDAGLSDHTQGIGVAVVAAGAGASVIEKHLILNRADGGLDAEFSLEPAEFTQMVAECRRAAVAIGTVQYGPSPGESTSLRRSLHFTKDLDAGLHAYADTLATARPAKGLPPAELPKVLGKRLKVAVSQGQPVTWDCFEE